MRMEELDADVPMEAQLAEAGGGPVVLVNVIHVPGDRVDAFLAALTDEAQYMKARPGCLSAQLHRGIAGSNTFLNYAVWESVAAFRTAFTDPAFREKLARYPDGVTASPHLFREMAVPGVCAG